MVSRKVLDKEFKGRNYTMCKPQKVMEVLQMGAIKGDNEITFNAQRCRVGL